MAYLWAGVTSHVAFVHYDVAPIAYLHHYLLFFCCWFNKLQLHFFMIEFVN